ncbi:MAG TPA: DinB family protein, partial [Bryobacteraceae bacterium]
MASRFPIRRAVFGKTLIACIVLAQLPAFAQVDVKAAVLKHLKVSRDFTLKVAAQMPDADYGFKLTPPQMSFAEQMVHLSQEQAGFLAVFSKDRPNPGKPASLNKKDVLAFIQQSFDQSIATVSKLTPAELAKNYQGDEGPATG